MLMKTLKWPAICLVCAGVIHLIAEAALPDLKIIFTPPMIAPLMLGFGIWTGCRAVQDGGNLARVILSGVLLGILPVVWDTVAFGMLLGRGVPMGMMAGIAAGLLIVWGSLLGGGFALSK